MVKILNYDKNKKKGIRCNPIQNEIKKTRNLKSKLCKT